MDRPKRSAGKPKHLHDEVDFTEAAIRRRPTKGKGVSKRKTPAVPKVVKAPPKARTSRVGRRKTVWDQEDASALIAKTTLLGEGVLPPSRPAPSTIWQLALASEPDSFSRYVNPCYLAAGPNRKYMEYIWSHITPKEQYVQVTVPTTTRHLHVTLVCR